MLPSQTYLVDAVMAVTLIEAMVLLAYFQWTGRGIRPKDFVFNLISGIGLMLALRSVVVGAPWIYLALCLGVAGLAHGADMWRRWRS
jgi:hypothetical protein